MPVSCHVGARPLRTWARAEAWRSPEASPATSMRLGKRWGSSGSGVRGLGFAFLTKFNDSRFPDICDLPNRHSVLSGSCAVARSEQIEARGRRNPEAYAVYVEGFRRPRTKRCDAYRHGALSLAELRIKGFPQPLAEQVEREHHDQDRGSRDQGQPRGVEDIALAVGEDIPPCRVGRRHPEAEEREA